MGQVEGAEGPACPHGPVVRPLAHPPSQRPAAWTENGFRSSWGKACDKAGILDVTFHDLRGTAATRLFIAECTEGEIAAFTGHRLSDVR